MQSLEVEAFLAHSIKQPIVDVRSPSEFLSGHIPGAINIPLFSDEERAQVGTTYKQVDRSSAVKQGLDFVGPKLSSFVSQGSELATDGKLLVHCWRGGMRSESFSWLLNTSGIESRVLQGGYKSYRRYAAECFGKPLNLVLLTGPTGSGKSEILQALKDRGEQIVDLETLARHKGSVFGGLGQEPQPTTEQFQNDLFQALRQLDTTRRIWLEDESIGIGNVFIPNPLWDQMVNSPMIRIELEKEERVNRLVTEYGQYSKEELSEATSKITKRLGDRVRETEKNLEQGDLRSVTRSLLIYYDKAYNNSIDNKPRPLISNHQFNKFDSNLICEQLLESVDRFEMIEEVHG